MSRQSQELQRNLFEDKAPRVVLAAAQIAALAASVESLLGEIATALANGEASDEQNHG